MFWSDSNCHKAFPKLCRPGTGIFTASAESLLVVIHRNAPGCNSARITKRDRCVSLSGDSTCFIVEIKE